MSVLDSSSTSTANSDKVLFYYNPMSRGRIVHWMLEETGAEYEIKLLAWEKKEHKSPEFLKINPMGKIPAIVHKSVAVTEAAAICTYLADAFPKAGLAPAVDDPARGTYYRWLFFAASCIEPAMMDRKFPRTDPVAASHLGYGSYDDTVNAMEQAVSKGFITGKFSAADVYMSSQIGWCMMNKDLEPRPAFEKYQKLCTERPAFQRFLQKAGSLS